MKQLIEDNYKSTIKRGLITKKTSHVDFIHKLKEETKELENEVFVSDKNKQKAAFEMADVILVVLNYARHYKIDIEHYLKEKIKINEQR